MRTITENLNPPIAYLESLSSYIQWLLFIFRKLFLRWTWASNPQSTWLTTRNVTQTLLHHFEKFCIVISYSIQVLINTSKLDKGTHLRDVWVTNVIMLLLIQLLPQFRKPVVDRERFELPNSEDNGATTHRIWPLCYLSILKTPTLLHTTCTS